ADQQKVSAAIAVAEASSNGEIVAVATPISDPYHDVALHWALIPLFAVLAWAAWAPTALVWWYDLLFGGWSPDPTMSQLFTLLIAEVREGRPADGIVAAIERVGAVLAEHFPRSADDMNEIPDKLIEL